MRSKTVLWWLLALALLPASTLIGGYTWLQTPDGKRWLADRIETAVNTQDRQLSIGALDGAIPFSPEITDVGFSDTGGRWLTVDRAAIRLDPTAILRWKVRFEAVETGRIEMLRLPTTPDSVTEDLSPTAFTWPELPIPVEIERLKVAEVALNVSVLGEPARFSVEGAVRLGDPAAGLSLDLSIARTDDIPGNLTAQMRYEPDTQRLTTKLRLDEPEVGMFARLAGLTGLPALTADLSGDGPLDDWRAELILSGGDDLYLRAEAAIRAEQAGRRVTLEASGRLAAFADDATTPLLDATTSLDGSVLVGPDDRLRIDRLELGGAFGQVSLTGGVDLAGQSMDMAMALFPGTPDRFARLIDGVSWSALRLSASLKGDFLEPTVNLSMEAGALAYGDMALESLTANAEVIAAAPLTDPGSRIEIATHFLVEGTDPGPGVPSGFLAPEMRVDTQGSIDRTGIVVVDSLKIDTPVARISAQGNGESWGKESATFGVTLDLPELSRLAPLANRSLDGAGTLELSADWDGVGAAIRASAELEQLSTGTAVADTLLGRAPRLALEASLGVDGAVAIKSLELSGSGLLMWLSGEIGADEVGIDWQLSLADLEAVATTLDGSLAATGRLTGAPNDPAVAARLTLADAVLAGHPISGANLDADFTGLFTGPMGRVAAEGNVAGLPVQATAELQLEKDGAIRVEELVLELASLFAEGALVLNADYSASGRVSAGIENLADLSPLVGATLSGALGGSATLSRDAGRQMIDLQVSATGAGLAGVVESRQATLKLQLSDSLAEPKVVADLQADGVSVGDLVLDRAFATAEGGLNGLDVALDLAAGALDANVKGRFAVADGETRIEIASLSARHDQITASLAGPARITLAQDLVLVDGLVLQAEGGRLSLDGRYGHRSDMNVTISDVPLELARLVAPDLGLSGRLDGGFRLIGSRTAPRVSGDLAATGLTLPAVRQAGIAGLDVKSRFDWDAATLDLDASVSGGFDGSLTASTRLSAPADPTTGLPNVHGGSSLTGRVSGSVRLDMLNDLLAARGDRVAGSIAIDLGLTGRLDDPRLGGTLALTDGSYRGPLTGIFLDDISARLNGDGDRLTISGFSASAPNGGTVRASGNIGLDAGFPADISVAFANALLIDNDLISAEVAGAVAITGELTGALDLSGRLTVVEAEIRLPERLPPSIQTLEVKEINVPPELKALRPPPSPKAGGSGAPLGIVLDLAIDSPGRIFVRGRGLEAEVAGEVTVRGNANAPKMSGGFQLRRGHLDALGRHFSFNEGVVTLPGDGSVDADIRFVARARASDVSAQITVTGRASAPQIQVESVPELPQDEILARILFGKRSDSLSALESIQLARSAFQLTGIGSSPDLLGGVGSRLGLDGIEVRQKGTNAGGPALNLRRRISEGISLGVQQGLQAGSGRATAELELMPNVSVETEVGVNNTGRVGIGMEWEY